MAALNESLGDLAPAAPEGRAAARRPGGLRASQRRRLNGFRYLVFTVFGLFFLIPLYAMVRFSLEGSKPGTWSFSAWTQIASYPGPPPLLSSIEITLELAVITSAVMLVLIAMQKLASSSVAAIRRALQNRLGRIVSGRQRLEELEEVRARLGRYEEEEAARREPARREPLHPAEDMRLRGGCASFHRRRG